jgi:hypothetical protein
MEKVMNKFAFAIALLLIAPSLRAQQTETTDNSQQAAAQTAAQSQSAQNPAPQDNLPAAIRPGHPLDPADVDVLTGKRDRDNEAARMAGVPISVGMYGSYGDLYGAQGRFGRAFDIPLLPLTQISNPFFFSRFQRGGFGRSGFRGRR